VHAIYERPWWRDLSPKLNGTGNGNQPTCEFTADSSLPAGGPGILTSFIAGNRAKEMLAWTEAQRGEAVLADYMAYFGPVAGNPQRYIEKVWPNETWTMGAFTAYPRPGIWTAYGPALRKPFMNVHWAGTETATRWAGYFDGAVRAGEDAARAVLEELGQG
jgi:monoamine oxidase